MIRNMESMCWLFMLIAGCIIQLFIYEALLLVYEMSYMHVVFITAWPILMFISFWNTVRILWRKK